MRNRISFILIALGLLLALFALADSGALSKVRLNRTLRAPSIVTDSSGILSLTGFNNPTYSLDNKTWKSVGTIINNSNTTLNVQVSVKLVSLIPFKTCTLQLKFNSYNNLTFSRGDIWVIKTTSISIAPGGTVQVEGIMTPKTGIIATTTFEFQASDTTGNISIDLVDNPNMRRCQNYI